jgi:hypothetical protein
VRDVLAGLGLEPVACSEPADVVTVSRHGGPVLVQVQGGVTRVNPDAAAWSGVLAPGAGKRAVVVWARGFARAGGVRLVGVAVPVRVRRAVARRTRRTRARGVRRARAPGRDDDPDPAHDVAPSGDGRAA